MDKSYELSGIDSGWQCFQLSNNVQPITLGLGLRREFTSEDFRCLKSLTQRRHWCSGSRWGHLQSIWRGWMIHPQSILLFTRWAEEVKIATEKKMEWLDFVHGRDDGLSCFCLNLHIFSDGPIVMLEVKLYKPRGSCKIPSTTETGGLTFCGMGRPPLVGPIGWQGLQNIVIPSGGSARTENKGIQTRRREGLSDRGSKVTARQPLGLQPVTGGERAGNRKWPVVCHWLCP